MVDAPAETSRTDRTDGARRRWTRLLAALLAPAAPLAAQPAVEVAGDRLSGFVLPVEPLDGEIEITALAGDAWTVDDTKRLRLRGDVVVRVGPHEVTGDDAVVWLNRVPSRDGLINQLAIYFDEVRNSRSRAGMGVRGRDLLVTASARGDVALTVVTLDRGRPAGDALVRRGEQRLADHLEWLVTGRPRREPLPQVEVPLPPEREMPVPGGRLMPAELETPPGPGEVEPAELPIFVPQGTVRFAAESLTLTPGAEENVVTAIGSVVVDYASNSSVDDWTRLTLSAERAVVFADPGETDAVLRGAADAGAVRGVYLEGNVAVVANEGEYVVRASRVYYDFRLNRATMLDAVLRTFSRELRVPVVARAEEMRQLSRAQWSARGVRISTSDFATPHLSLGAERVTITQREADAADGGETHVDSRGNTVRVGDLPIAYWPRYRGTAGRTPLRGVAVSTRSDYDLGIETRWDLFGLLGVEAPGGTDLELKVDGFIDRGPAVGLVFDYDVADAEGRVDLYGLHDEGVDRTSAGLDVDPEHDFRGVALWEQQARLGRWWTVQAQASYISDETFITTWREEAFSDQREYETSVYLKRQRRNAAFTALLKYDINDFISTGPLLASQPYIVEKLPELTYRRYGDSLFGDRITSSGELRVSRLRLSFVEATPAQLGVPGRAFGLGDDDRIDDALAAAGLPSKWVSRADYRQELALPIQAGAVRIVPFVVGRATAYDDDFESFSSDSDDLRFFAAGGVRIATQLQHVDNDAESRLLDVHRLRHVVEPHAVLWYGWSDVDQSDLPVYDLGVESLATGTVAKLAVTNTWQTQRGGPGRWRTVDLLTVDTGVVIASDDTDRESPLLRFFDYRPEYSLLGGDFVYNDLVWRVSDSVAVISHVTYDLDDSAVTHGSVGGEMRHSDQLTTYVEYRYIDAADDELLDVSWQYRLSRRYAFRIRPQWDFDESTFRAFAFRVTRAFPNFDLNVDVRYDDIQDETFVGASIGRVDF